MSQITPDVLQEIMGPVASGPAGFGINYKIADNAHLDAGATNVEAELDEKSLAQAKAQNEGGINKQVSKSLIPAAPEIKPSPAMTAMTLLRENTEARYASLFPKRGLAAALDRGSSPAPRFDGNRPNHRSALSHNPKLSTNLALRIKQRHLLRLRATFNEIAKKKTVAVNLEKVAEFALQKGIGLTPLSPLAKPVAKAIAEKVTNYDPKQWNKWQHALMDGSFPQVAPRPRGA